MSNQPSHRGRQQLAPIPSMSQQLLQAQYLSPAQQLATQPMQDAEQGGLIRQNPAASSALPTQLSLQRPCALLSSSTGW